MEMAKNTGAGAPAGTAFIRCVWKILFLSKHPSRQKCSSSDLCIFCLLSSTKWVPMYLVTCWKNKQSHIFISPCRNDHPQLQNCRQWDFSRFLGLLLVTWRQREEILSPAHPRTKYVCLFLQVPTFHSFDAWGTAPLQRLCQNMSAPGTDVTGFMNDVRLSNCSAGDTQSLFLCA